MARAVRAPRALLVAAAILLPVLPSAAATFLHVDRDNPSCSDAGSGTPAVPYCTIGAASADALAGTTVRVASGTYSEQVMVQNAGTAAAPIVFEPVPGANVTLTSSGHGFVNYNKSWITIRGFNITNTVGGYGIYLYYASNNTISDNRISFAGRPLSGQTRVGIYLKGMTDTLIAGNVTDHNSDAGIYLTTNTTRVTVKDNTSFANARGYASAAPGIDVRAPGNTIIANTVYSNEDSGIQVYPGGTNTVVNSNVVYDNGDYGIDVSSGGSATVVGNSVFRNRKSGINVEGTSSGSRLANNLSVDNGLGNAASKGNISVDSQSIPGTTVDYDLVYLSSPGRMITWGGSAYTSLASFVAATGQETHGIQANPGWVAPTSGDFHLTPASPAIDSANSDAPSQSPTDRDGNDRFDDPASPNTGAGPRPFDDRGAYEFQLLPGSDDPPQAALTVTTSSGTVPLSVTADASASTDPDLTSPIASYAFDFGDGTLVGPQPEATAPHTFASPGGYTVTVTVTDTAGLSDTASVQVTATSAAVNLVGNPGFEANTSGWNTSGGPAIVLTRVEGGHSGGWAAQIANTGAGVSASCTLNDSPNWERTTQAGTYHGSLWVRAPAPGAALKLKFREYQGGTLVGSKEATVTLTTAWQQVQMSYAVVAPGSSTLDFIAYITNAPSGVCFLADDAMITRT
jgi:parallel beta-helix repeat protein